MTKSFKKFLCEDSKGNPEEIAELADKIHRDCQPFLRANPPPLYRGATANENPLNPLEQTKFRVPRDSSDDFNFMFNAGCEMVYGVKDLRTKAVFAIGNPKVTKAYGDPHLIYPKGNFKFIWSPEMTDSVSMSFQIYVPMAKDFGGVPLSFVEHIFREISEEYDGSSTKWVNRESSSSYSGISDRNVKAALKNAFKKLYRDDDIKAAIESRDEILIYESEGYYSVPVKWLTGSYDGFEEAAKMMNELIEEQ